MSPFERLRGAHLSGHPALEDFVFSVLSILVLAVAIIAVAMPQDAVVTAAMAAPKPGTPVHAVFYGTLVDAAGRPRSDARVRILSEAGTVLASTTTNAQGEWDVRFKDERNMPKDYTIEVTIMVDGQPVTGTTEITASTGYLWGVQLVFSEPSSFVFVPLPGY